MWKNSTVSSRNFDLSIFKALVSALIRALKDCEWHLWNFYSSRVAAQEKFRTKRQLTVHQPKNDQDTVMIVVRSRWSMVPIVCLQNHDAAWRTTNQRKWMQLIYILHILSFNVVHTWYKSMKTFQTWLGRSSGNGLNVTMSPKYKTAGCHLNFVCRTFPTGWKVPTALFNGKLTQMKWKRRWPEERRFYLSFHGKCLLGTISYLSALHKILFCWQRKSTFLSCFVL